jgi:DNA-binding transcriptional MerR regulator
MAQLSLFDATPPEPKVPRPPARKSEAAGKKTNEEPLAAKETAVEKKAASNAFHFEPAPVYTDDIALPTVIVDELPVTYVPQEEPEAPIEAKHVVDDITTPSAVVVIDDVPELITSTTVTEQVSEKKKSTPQGPSEQKNEGATEEIEETPFAADTAQLTKQYYSISEVSAMFNVNASHLRYWEKEFPTQLGKVRKNGKGDRFYTPKNIEQLHVLFYLVKTKKMTLEGARNYLKQKKRSAKSDLDAVTLLQQVRGFLVSLKKELND